MVTGYVNDARNIQYAVSGQVKTLPDARIVSLACARKIYNVFRMFNG